MKSKLVRILAGVVAGMAAIIVIVMAVTFATSALAPGYGADVETPAVGWILLNLAYSFAAAVFGGWLAQRIARTRIPIAPALLIAFMMVSSFGIIGDTTSPWPAWYRWSLFLFPAPAVALGAYLASRRPAAGTTEPQAGISVSNKQ